MQDSTSTLRLRVRRKEPLTPHVVEVWLASEDGGGLPLVEPGAHIEVLLPAGLTRQYSLIPSPHHDEWRVAVLHERDGRGGSSFIHEELTVGDVVEAKVPRTQFNLDPAERYLFLAGGIGITPFLSMIEQAKAQGSEWRLVYTGRDLQSMAYAETLRSENVNEVEIHVSSASGRVHLGGVLADHPSAEVYCCGPDSFLDEATVAAAADGRTIHFERFRADDALQEGDEEFEIELAQSGMLLTVPADRTALDVVEDAGVFVMFSCREGTCGTCETPVLSGEIDHRDSVLSPEERAANNCMMICVSRAATESRTIRLDL